MAVEATSTALESEGGVWPARQRGHQARYRQIVQVLLRHGLGALAGTLGASLAWSIVRSEQRR